MVLATNLGFPRFGPNRELKKAVEGFWSGKVDRKSLLTTAKELRVNHWRLQKATGIQHVPSNDFSFYDQVLDASFSFGAIPERYAKQALEGLQLYFAMARGLQKEGIDVPAMEMKKWFDTNYHYIVPEFTRGMQFRVAEPTAVNHFVEAKEAGVHTRPVLIGPISYLLLGKTPKDDQFDVLKELLPSILPVYEELLSKLAAEGADWVQMDEPVLVTDRASATHIRPFYEQAYSTLTQKVSSIKMMVTTYFDRVADNLSTIANSNVAGIHVDLVRAPQQLDDAIAAIKDKSMVLSLGLIDGRNVWKTDLGAALAHAQKAVQALGKDRVFIAPSCSLLHTPHSLEAETKMDKEILNWLAFSVEKLNEIVTLAKASNDGVSDVQKEIDANRSAIESRRTSSRIHNAAVKQRISNITPEMKRRKSPFATRFEQQRSILNLPMFPTTTIGSFPQTKEVRQNRANFKKGAISREQYMKFVREETIRCLRFQEKVGLAVVVDGEFDRNDMVEFFGENMEGYVFSQNGWVQSYGSRGVKPPIIFGDVSRPKAITVEMSQFAQSQTEKKVKGMLTGPVTMLQWSFVRNDQPRSQTTFQLACAILDEVQDLERAGLRIIQVDEPAIREGLPLRKADWDEYLQWAVEAFRIATSGVEDSTQIHTHMCYSDFNDILHSIQRMDADVITIENSRSDLKLLAAFEHQQYTNQIGPGVYDIHSPRVPSTEEMTDRAHQLLKHVSPQLLWINPDCGLKTRGWVEVEASLTNLCAVAKSLREDRVGK